MSTPFATGACERSSRTQNCCAEFSAHLHPGGGCVRRGRSRATTRANRAVQCVRACARSARTRDRHASRISIGRCACASLRECTMKRPRNRVERSTPLTTAITREWKNREYDRTRSASERFLSNFRENSFFSLLEKCSRSYLNGARDYLLIRSSTTVR